MKPINSLVALLDIGNIFGGVAERENAHDLSLIHIDAADE